MNTDSYGRESLRYGGPLTWELLPDNIKECFSRSFMQQLFIAGGLAGYDAVVFKMFTWF